MGESINPIQGNRVRSEAGVGFGGLIHSGVIGGGFHETN